MVLVRKGDGDATTGVEDGATEFCDWFFECRHVRFLLTGLWVQFLG
jgi:hypothetical protein